LKKLLIVGGSGGIGIEIIKNILRSGNKVINLDKSKSNIKHKNLKNIIIDLNNVNLKILIEKIILEEKKIDYFVCSIGYYNPNAKNTLEEYEINIKINLDIPIKISLMILNHMKNKVRKGTIILITSEAAIGGSRSLGYSVSKSALEGFRRFLALETSKTSINIYSVAPGIIDTSMSSKLSKKRKSSTITKTYEKRMGKPIEVSKLVLFLIFQAPSYMKGQCILIDGGLASRYK